VAVIVIVLADGQHRRADAGGVPVLLYRTAGTVRDLGDLPAGHAAGDDRVAVAWTGGVAEALDLFVRPAPITEHVSGGQRRARGRRAQLGDLAERRIGRRAARTRGHQITDVHSRCSLP
jgi:hypothetical protein